jgi:large subunit ribosomal protein L24
MVTIMKIKKGDNIEIIAGKDKGKRGKVVRTLPRLNKVVVEKLNIQKKHLRPRKEGEQGQRVEIAAPINISNVMLVCPHTDKLTRVGYRVDGGQKVRISKRSQKEI